MFVKRIAFFVAISALALTAATNTFAQDTNAPAAQASPDTVQQQEEKTKLEAKAVTLLEQVLSEAQSLKLPENKIRVHIVAADLLWERIHSRLASAGERVSTGRVFANEFAPTGEDAPRCYRCSPVRNASIIRGPSAGVKGNAT